MSLVPLWQVRVDTGGTFTDGWAKTPDGATHRVKVLSDGTLMGMVAAVAAGEWFHFGPSIGFSEQCLLGYRTSDGASVTGCRGAGAELMLDRSHPGGRLILLTGEDAPVVAVRLLTGTAACDDLPEMELRVATTRATNALLEGTTGKPVLFVTRGFGDLPWLRDQRRNSLFALEQEPELPLCGEVIEIDARLDPAGRVVTWPNESEVRNAARECLDRGEVVAVVAVLHAWAAPEREREIECWLREEGFLDVSCSSAMSANIGFLARLETALADAALAGVMGKFVAGVRAALPLATRLHFMTSSGGLVPAARFRAKDSLLSGPAGGIVGAAAAARQFGWKRVLTIDMGGTSTDVARIDEPMEYRHSVRIGRARVLSPALKIETVAAGGGSICRWHLGALEVGPASAGADPGPACYGRGGPLTLTDVNLLLGNFNSREGIGIPLDHAAAERALEDLIATMREENIEPPPQERLLQGLRSIAIEKMAEALRRVSLADGYDVAEFGLIAFGGAGPQHACELAERLGIHEVIVPGDAGLFSAWGLHRATREEHTARQVLRPLIDVSTEQIWHELALQAGTLLEIEDPEIQYSAELRLAGQESVVTIAVADPDAKFPELTAAFSEGYHRLYQFPPDPGRAIELVMLRVVASERADDLEPLRFPDQWIAGPDQAELRHSTCLVPTGWSYQKSDCDPAGSLRIRMTDRENSQASVELGDAVRAALFQTRFHGIVEETGSILQRTALSINVKERLDYSCALLDASGHLVVNAPHVPVHLGALGVCVRAVIEKLPLREGDVAVTNHPAFGGSHLPDVTVIAPAFAIDGTLLGYFANRAHHSEIGGMAPGSMPAEARRLSDEGVVIFPRLLVGGEQDGREEVRRLLAGWRWPSRKIDENLADLDAQMASALHGVRSLRALAADAGGELVREMMANVSSRSARLMRAHLKKVGVISASRREMLDDGHHLDVRLMTTPDGRLAIDFTGSSRTHPGNLNMTPAIVRSVVLYVMRVWLGADVPLNEGLLEDLQMIIPGGILDPDFPEDPDDCPAVVGGNVETSQRLADGLFAALEICANGQGTMNNFLFGNEHFGYYETLGGGGGAHAGGAGTDARHVHMTNTAITDAEILEHRFPVRLHEFSLRCGSAGAGRHCGGRGLVREIEFLEPLTVSFLAERRVTRPSGLAGGDDGIAGFQKRIFADGSIELLAGRVTYAAAKGERVRIETPGGGGWGRPRPQIRT